MSTEIPDHELEVLRLKARIADLVADVEEVLKRCDDWEKDRDRWIERHLKKDKEVSRLSSKLAEAIKRHTKALDVIELTIRGHAPDKDTGSERLNNIRLELFNALMTSDEWRIRVGRNHLYRTTADQLRENLQNKDEELEKLKAQLAEARKDSEILDWLHENLRQRTLSVTDDSWKDDKGNKAIAVREIDTKGDIRKAVMREMGGTDE